MKIKLSELIKLELASIIILLFLTFSFYCLFFKNIETISIIPQRPILGIAYTITLVFQNMRVYFVTFLLFMISPVPILYNWFILLCNIGYNIKIVGINTTLHQLLPHGLLEVPTIILYQYLSYKMMMIAYKYKNSNALLMFIKENKSYFILIPLLLVVSSFIEGLIG